MDLIVFINSDQQMQKGEKSLEYKWAFYFLFRRRNSTKICSRMKPCTLYAKLTISAWVKKKGCRKLDETLLFKECTSSMYTFCSKKYAVLKFRSKWTTHGGTSFMVMDSWWSIFPWEGWETSEKLFSVPDSMQQWEKEITNIVLRIIWEELSRQWFHVLSLSLSKETKQTRYYSTHCTWREAYKLERA